MLESLKEQVYEANLTLPRHGLVALTWGNVSGIDRGRGVIAIKPSGVPYPALEPGMLVLLDLDGRVVEGDLNPSSDAPTHLELYRAFAGIGGVTHTHSPYATMFAQARRAIPPLGTTHADHFLTAVPVTRELTPAETAAACEANTGRVIIERFASAGIDAMTTPAALVAAHGPFTWGRDAGDSARNAAVLEEVARLALGTLQIDPAAAQCPPYLLARHFRRKHGPGATYGQARG